MTEEDRKGIARECRKSIIKVIGFTMRRKNISKKDTPQLCIDEIMQRFYDFEAKTRISLNKFLIKIK